MEKSNSFKRVLAGTLALLTVASSVPAEAGSVIGDFFGSALVANAADSVDATTAIAVTNVVVNGTSGTAKVSIGGGDAVDANVTVAADATNANIKTFTITRADTSAFNATNGAAITVDGYTAIGTAKVNNGAIEVKVNTFIARPAEGTTEFEFDGTPKSVLFGKKMQGDEGAMAGADGNNTVEIAYMTSAAGSDYVVIPEEELTNKDLFTWSCATVGTGTVGDKGGKNVCEITKVNRADGAIDGTVTNHIITITGNEGTKYAGLTFEAKLLITPLDITNKATVTDKSVGTDYSIPHAIYDRLPVDNTDIIDSAKVKNKDTDATEHTLVVDEDYKLTFEGRTDTEAGQNGVLTGADGKVNENDASQNKYAVNVGLYTATLNYGGNYTGSSRVSFRIMPQPVSNATLIDEDTVVKYTLDDTTDGIAKGKDYDRKPYEPVAIKDKDNNPYGVTLVTYKAELNADGSVKRDEQTHIAVPSTTVATDTSAVGTYVTVVTPSGNYKKADAEKDKPAAIEWTINKYDILRDSAARITVAGEAIVDPSTGKAVASLTVRDKAEVDNAAQAGVRLVEGTEYTVKYSTSNLDKGSADWKTTVPDDVTPETGLYVLITGTGNYEGVRDTLHLDVVTGKYDAATATLTTKTSTNEEQVKYQYGDPVGATVTTAPGSLTQEVRYVPVTIDTMGAPTAVRAITGHDCTAYFTKDADNKLVLGTTDGTTIKALTDAQINALFNASLEKKDLNADETEDHGYIAVVFVNRKATDGVDACENYKPLFESKAAISKGFTVSVREVTDSSKVEIEFVNPLLPYIGHEYSATQLEQNIKSIKVDGVKLVSTGAVTEGVSTLAYADFNVDVTDNAITEVGNYSIKLNFGDATKPISTNFKGTFKTNAETQKLSVVATQVVAADFLAGVNTLDEIQAVYTKDGAEYIDGVTKLDATTGAIDPAGTKIWKYNELATDEEKAKFTFAYYKIKTNPKYEANTEREVKVRAIGDENGQTENDVKVKYPSADYQVTGNKQTDAGPYEITIAGVKNLKGSITVKWSIEGNTFDGFTATADKTTFDYNGKGQSPVFTVSRTNDDKTTTTLTEGKDYAIEYYANGTKLDGKPQNVGTYTAKIVGINSYYGAVYKEKGEVKEFTFTIAPSSDLDITITAKKGADFSYNGKNLVDRVNDLFDINVDGKKLDEDADNYIYHITPANAPNGDARTAKNVGKYKISVTVYDDNYQPKTSAPTDFEITPKEITLSNIKANVKTAVYGAPVAQINDSITFDYTGVLEEDADKVSVADFRGFVVVSNNYRSGSPAGEYTLTYNDKFEPVSTAAKNYKAKKFSDTEKITIAKKDLADAKANVSLVVVKSQFANTAPDVAGEGELKANQIVYNGQPYEVYIQKNDNGLMTMADLKLTGSPKALHAADDYEVVAVASANGNYTGTATLNLAWAIKQCEIGYDVDVSVAKKITSITTVDNVTTTTTKLSYLAENNNNEVGTAISVSNKIGSDADVLAGKATYCIATNVSFYTVDDKGNKTYFADPKTAKAGASVNYYRADNADATNFASEAAGDYTVYFYQLDDKGQPIESTKTTGYPTTGGKYRATVEFSKDFVLVNSTAPSEDPDFVPKKAEIGYVDFTVKGKGVNAEITDNNGKDFVKTYGDSEEPSFTITFNGSDSTTWGDDLITAKVDVTKMYKVDEKGNYILDNNKNKIPYDGTAGYYDLEGAVVMNDTDYSCNFYRVRNTEGQITDKFNYKYINNKLVYQVKQSTDYTIQFDHENNVFALKNGKAVAGYQVVDNNSGKVMTEGVDYTLKGSNEVYKTGKYTLFVDGMGNYTGDAHADWVVTSGDTSVDAKLIDSNTVSFKDQVEFNFLAEINDSAYADGAYVKFTYDHYGEKTEVTKYLSKTDMYGKYYRFRLPLTASEMAIDVKADLYLKNSAKPISTKTRSIKDYAEKAIAKNLDGSDVLKAMLNYGGYTQVALGNNTSLLANASADIKEDVSAIAPKSQSTFVKPTAYEGTRTVGSAGIPQSVKIKFTPFVTYKGTTVLTRSKLFVRHYFIVDSRVDQDELKEITVSTWFDPKTGLSGWTNTKLVDLSKNSTGYYFDVPAEYAYNLDKDRGTVYVYDFPGIVTNAEAYTATDGTKVAAGATTYKVGARDLQGVSGHNYAEFNDYRANGDKDEFGEGKNIYGIEVTNYNVIDYCEAIVGNAKQTTAAKNMVKALYKYFQAAEAYVAKRS